MAILTVRNIPDDLVRRLKAAAKCSGRSMEQEVRELLRERYRPRAEILAGVRQRWRRHPGPPAREVRRWIEEGRP